MRRSILALLLPALLAGCAFHSTATRWNGLVGPDGEPVFYVATTKVGTNLLIAIPFLGGIGIDGQVDTLTRGLQERGGDRVRIVQGSTENYWYGFPPFTWILTPVVTTITAEFKPSIELFREVLAEQLRDEHEGLSDYEFDRLVDAEIRRYLPNLPDRELDPGSPVVPRPAKAEGSGGGAGEGTGEGAGPEDGADAAEGSPTEGGTEEQPSDEGPSGPDAARAAEPTAGGR
jgi:hypothetical protein